MSFDRISVIGLGYIGLPTAAMFASRQRSVIGVDVNQHAVDTVNAGKVHIVEPELDVMVKNAVDSGFLRATTKAEPADAFLIAVPTPFLPINNSSSIPEPDLAYIKSAAKSVAKVLNKGNLVILESTSPVGATEQLAKWLSEQRPDLTFPQSHGEDSDIRVAYCPERVLPGQVVRELVENDRIIGGMTTKCSQAAADVYSIFVNGNCVVTDSKTAEMAKLTENASRDVSIAFANELSIICDSLEIDVWELISMANLHPRVDILQPGPGVGGHCIAVDPWFIASAAPDHSPLIQTARAVNNGKPSWVVNKVKSLTNKMISGNGDYERDGVVIVVFGLTFKPDIDDLRESPALFITKQISKLKSVRLFVVEPNICQENIPAGLSSVSLDEGLRVADIAVLLVDHTDFKSVSPPANTAIIDTKGIWT